MVRAQGVDTFEWYVPRVVDTFEWYVTRVVDTIQTYHPSQLTPPGGTGWYAQKLLHPD